MPQKIKKQIKRSMPWLMIISLLTSTVAAGLVFNLDVKISQTLDKKFNIDLGLPKVEANQDNATTTVQVRNAPPAFNGNVVENPVSTSTSPINIGAGISFIGTGDDPEGNSYYLVVCSTNSVVASSTGGAPTCSATRFCVSAVTADNVQTTCDYNSVADPGAQTQDWYAFVCDNHATEGECVQVANQGAAPGTGDNSSPFYVNHAPVFSAVNTTDNNKDPGGSFTITGSVIDPDTARGAEEMGLYICNTNSWATSTGCAGGQLCYATSTSPDIACTFATTTPARDGTWTYYAFVKDVFNMPASGNSQTNSYVVNNVAPTVTGVGLHSGLDITLNIKGASEVTATSASVSITDNNGCTDIVRATSSIYWQSVTGEYECIADDNNCYQIGQVDCTAVAGSCTGPGDPTMGYTCSTTLAYHAIPTDSMSTGNPASTTKWMAAIKVFDEALAGVGTTTTGVEVGTNSAIEITETEINYGNVRSGRDTGTSTATTTIINIGNSPLDADIGGDYMRSAGPLQIPNNEQKYDFAYGFDYQVAGTPLAASSTPATVDLDIARPTSAANFLDYLYWGINIPVGTPSGDYYGRNFFSAAIDDNGTWNIP